MSIAVPLRRALLGAALVVVALGLAPAPAGADCASPTLAITPVTGDPAGHTVLVSGRGFGTACNDTGSPPLTSVLGAPRTRIQIVAVQGGTEVPLVSVDADGDYRFDVRLGLPSGLATGAAAMEARSAEGVLAGPVPFLVVAVADTPPDPEIVSGRLSGSGRAPVPTTLAPPVGAAPASKSTTPWLVGGGVIALAAVATIIRARRMAR